MLFRSLCMNKSTIHPVSSNVIWQQAIVTRKLREAQNGHRGAIVWFTGLSGSGNPLWHMPQKKPCIEKVAAPLFWMVTMFGTDYVVTSAFRMRQELKIFVAWVKSPSSVWKRVLSSSPHLLGIVVFAKEKTFFNQ